jgi:hypothetical protein
MYVDYFTTVFDCESGIFTREKLMEDVGDDSQTVSRLWGSCYSHDEKTQFLLDNYG